MIYAYDIRAGHQIRLKGGIVRTVVRAYPYNGNIRVVFEGLSEVFEWDELAKVDTLGQREGREGK